LIRPIKISVPLIRPIKISVPLIHPIKISVPLIRTRNLPLRRSSQWHGGLTGLPALNTLDLMSHPVRALFTSFYYFGRFADQGGKARA
jgi:hypothetical protein